MTKMTVTRTAVVSQRARQAVVSHALRAAPGPLHDAELPGLLLILLPTLQKGTDADEEIVSWLAEYELTRDTMRRRLAREAAAAVPAALRRRRKRQRKSNTPIFGRNANSGDPMTTDTNETDEQKQKRILEEARTRLRNICGADCACSPHRRTLPASARAGDGGDELGARRGCVRRMAARFGYRHRNLRYRGCDFDRRDLN